MLSVKNPWYFKPQRRSLERSTVLNFGWSLKSWSYLLIPYQEAFQKDFPQLFSVMLRIRLFRHSKVKYNRNCFSCDDLLRKWYCQLWYHCVCVSVHLSMCRCICAKPYDFPEMLSKWLLLLLFLLLLTLTKCTPERMNLFIYLLCITNSCLECCFGVPFIK